MGEGARCSAAGTQHAMTFLDPAQAGKGPLQLPELGGPEAAAELPDAHALFLDHEGDQHDVAGAQLPDADHLFPTTPPERDDRSDGWRSRAATALGVAGHIPGVAGIVGPIKGAVAPGPVGDWIFGNTQHSSLARIMNAFGATVAQDVSGRLAMSDETREYLKKRGIFNDYVNGQASLLKANAETLARSGAVIVNGAIYGVPAVFHGLQDAVFEAGQQAEGTFLGKSVGVGRLARDVAASFEALPDTLHIAHVPVPQALATALDLNVIGSGGEAAWKGVAREEVPPPPPARAESEPGGPTAPVEAAAEALPSTPAAAPDVHAIARTIAPQTFTEFDSLEKRRDLFRKWIDDPENVVPPNVPQELKAIETRLRELEPAVTAAYDKAKEGLPDVGPASTDTPAAGASTSEAGAAPAPQAEEGTVPAEGAAPSRVAGEAGTQAAPPRSIEDQRDYIVQDVKRQMAAAGRPADEAAAVAQLVAARYETRAARMGGALGTAEELYDREAAEIRGQQIARKVTSPTAARALDRFQERMAAGKEQAKKRADEGDTQGRVVSTEERFAGQTEEAWRAAQEDAVEALEPEERESARHDMEGLLNEDDLRFLAEQAEKGEFFQIEAYHGSPHLFDRFDISKIGTGEGAQAFGHGLYFAESEGVARSYQEALKLQGVDWTDPKAVAGYWADEFKGDRSEAARYLETASDKNMPAARQAIEKQAIDLLKSEQPLPAVGALYKVSLKPDKEDLLDLDKRLSEQPQKVQDGVRKAIEAAYPARAKEMTEKIWDEARHAQGESLVRRGLIAFDDKRVSKLLAEAGIPGIKYLDQSSRSKGEGTHNFVVFDDKDVEITHRNGAALTKEERANAVRELEQRGDQSDHIKQGGIKLNPKGPRSILDFTGIAGTHPILTLMKNANASTAVHELGHEWLAQMLRDAEHEKAPADLKADRDTVLKWFGIDKTEDIQTRHHEKFARGFEQYLRLGIAPSKELASVFAKFKAWLTRVYQSLKGLGEPISDDIQQVFDRLLVKEPQRVVAAAERQPSPEFHEQHEAMADATPPEAADQTELATNRERDSIARETLVKDEEDARLGDVDTIVGRQSPGGEEPPGVADAAGPQSGEAGVAPQAGTVGAGLGETGAKGDRAREIPSGPNAKFATPPNDLIDKAGNIRLDKLNRPDDVDAVIRTAARNNNDFLENRRGALSDGQTLDLADALGMDPAWLDRKKIGDAYNVEEIRAARRLLVQSATGVREAMIAAKNGDAAALQKLAETIARHEMIQGKVSGATAEAGRALRAFREVLPGATEATQLDMFLKQNTGRTLFQLQEMARYGANLTSPAQVSRFVHDTANGQIKQAVIFYYVNSLISGPITHTRYFAGNALTAMWAPVKTTVAATLDSAATIARLQDERRIFFGEAGAELYALGKGSREGWKAAGEGWQTGNTPHLPGEAPPNMFESQPTLPPIPGPIGRVIGLPGKAVGAIHGFSSAVRYEQEIAKLAYRQAMREGLSGDAFTSRVADLGNRPTPEMTEAAAKVARADLYMAPADFNSAEASLARFANSNIITKIILPFTKIGTQIASQAIKNSPLGLVYKEVRENLSGANGIEARNTQAASIIASTALMGTFAQMAAEGMVTGGGPEDPSKRREWLLSHKPYHLSVGPISIPYHGLGMLGMQMGWAANAYETAHGWGEEDGAAVALSFLKAFQEAVLDDTWLRGVKDMLEAAFHWDEYGDRYVSNMVTNWVPFSVGISQINRAYIDPYQRETHGSSLLDTIFKEAQAKVPWASQGLYPRRDMFGEPIPASGQGPDYTNDPVVKMMDEVHLGVGRLSRKIRGVALTDAQYDDFARIAGRTAKMMLDRAVRTPGFTKMPPNMRADQMKNLIKLAHEQAEKTIMMHAYGSDNDIQAQATQAKKIKKGLVAPDTVH